MNNGFHNFLEQELHEQETSDPQMKKRLRARFWIIASAVPIVPVSVFVLILTMLSWDASSYFPSRLWTFSLLHPFLSCLCVMIAMMVHKQAAYKTSMFITVFPQVASLVNFFTLYILWAFDFI